eukprot:191382-Amphidinium_carterae.2
MQLLGAEVKAPRGIQQASQDNGRPRALLGLGSHREGAEPLSAAQEIGKPVLLPLAHRLRGGAQGAAQELHTVHVVKNATCDGQAELAHSH